MKNKQTKNSLNSYIRRNNNSTKTTKKQSATKYVTKSFIQLFVLFQTIYHKFLCMEFQDHLTISLHIQDYDYSRIIDYRWFSLKIENAIPVRG